MQFIHVYFGFLMNFSPPASWDWLIGLFASILSSASGSHNGTPSCFIFDMYTESYVKFISLVVALCLQFVPPLTPISAASFRLNTSLLPRRLSKIILAFPIPPKVACASGFVNGKVWFMILSIPQQTTLDSQLMGATYCYQTKLKMTHRKQQTP